MNDDKLRQTVLTTMGMLDAPKEEQDAALYRLESIAQTRFALALPEMLSKEQLNHSEAMRTAGKTDDEISQWIEEQLPQYDEMIRAIIQDIADEVAE